MNHELGKVKESLVSESSAVASRVGSLIRSESTRYVNFTNFFLKNTLCVCLIYLYL